MTICIGGGLGKDCLDEDIQGIEPLLTGWYAVHGSEILNRVSDALFRFRSRFGLHQRLSSTAWLLDATAGKQLRLC